VLCLVSGGGSALLSLPAPGPHAQDKQAINQALLKSGAAIDEMNCVRKHLSASRAGAWRRCARRRGVVTLLISDVPGDDPQ
jgi:glycerate 2-kinase